MKPGNNILSVLCKAKSELSYTRQRLCVRNSSREIQKSLDDALLNIENAIFLAETKRTNK